MKKQAGKKDNSAKQTKEEERDQAVRELWDGKGSFSRRGRRFGRHRGGKEEETGKDIKRVHGKMTEKTSCWNSNVGAPLKKIRTPSGEKIKLGKERDEGKKRKRRRPKNKKSKQRRSKKKTTRTRGENGSRAAWGTDQNSNPQ